MADLDDNQCRLCLVTPAGAAPESFAPILDEALSGGDVASLIVTADSADQSALAEAVVPLAQARNVAAIIQNDVETAMRTQADGVHVDDREADFAALAAALRPGKIAGAGGLTSRHAAMQAGEADPDYVFFSRLDGDTEATIFDKTLSLAEWWAALFELPAIVMGGSTLDSVRQARGAGIEFVALRRAVWEHPEGAKAAVETANRLLVKTTETVR